jgi:signal transduction histidine kinase/CheY-like chemotaxis protein/HPt (histidine-containing phosphotransfer) domain-containing protein
MPTLFEKTRASHLRSLLDRVFAAGVFPEMSPDLAKRVTACNQLSATLGLLCIPYVFVFWELDAPDLSYATILLLGGFSGIIALNQLGRTWLSRMAYVLLANGASFAYGMALGPHVGFQLFFFSTIAVPFILFSWEERKSWLSGVALGVLLMLAFEVIRDYRGDAHVLAPATERTLFYVILVTAQFVYLMVTLQLILGNRTTQGALAQAVQAAKAADKAKTQFLANMSHEIRTPMNGILGLSDLLSKANLNPREMESVSAIRSSARDLLEIINEILDLSKIEAGKMRLERVPFDPARLVSSLGTVFSGLAVGKNLTWTLDAARDLPPRLLGDPVRIRQVLTNLVGNAFKFTHEGGVTLRIRMTDGVKNGGATIAFQVEDTGVGIPPRSQHGIFQAFSQAEDSTTRKYGGTGLGLHICKQIVEMMGGTIGFRSEEGKGSVFHFSVPFPIAPPETAAVNAVSTRMPRQNLRLNQALRVLIVDDQPVNRRVLSGMLSAYGVKAEVAENGVEAVQACTRRDYDIVFLDSHMPQMDGYECSRALRAAEIGKRRRIIIGCTADAMPGSREKCLEAGMDDMITKPILDESLTAMLNRWAEKYAEADTVLDVSPSPPPPPPSEPESWLDLKQVNQMTNWTAAYDQSFWEKMLVEFESSYVRLTSAIRKACDEGSFQSAGEAAHALKGVSAMMGFGRMAEICKNLEALGSGGDAAQWPALYAKLEASYAPSMGAIRERIGAKN